MSRTHLSVLVELVSGHGRDYWPRPGRVLMAGRRTMTFGAFADAVDTAFGRWDFAHLHTFDLDDGTLLIGPAQLSDAVRLSRLTAGEQFAYTFDMGDDWTHLCTRCGVAGRPVRGVRDAAGTTSAAVGVG